MRTRHLIYMALLCLTMSSCHTALHIAPLEKLKGDFGTPNMEFIGFVNTPHVESVPRLFQSFGRDLERCNIAINHQAYSLGSMFDPAQLASFQPSSRFVSYVNVLNIEKSYNDAISDNQGMITAGWMVAGLTIFALYPVYLPLILAGDKNECQQRVLLDAELCIYDTKKKEICQTIPIQIDYRKIYKGQFLHKKTNLRELEESERSILTNTVLNFYGQAHNYITELIASEPKEPAQKPAPAAAPKSTNKKRGKKK